MNNNKMVDNDKWVANAQQMIDVAGVISENEYN